MPYSEIIAFIGYITSIILSVRLLFLHLTHFTQPKFQLHICRILLMVPIYATQSFLSFLFPHIAIYLDVIRDCYEAYVLNTFMSLLINYLGGEEAIVLQFNAKEQIRHPWPFRYALKPIVCDRKFFWNLKRCVAQFIVIKPFVAILSLILNYKSLYNKSAKKGMDNLHLYVSGLNYISTGVAMYTLILFYLATRDKLAPFRPLSKFLCVKAVIFFSFWQSCILSWIIHWELIQPQFDVDERTTALVLQDWLICVELPWLAIAHIFTFSHKQFNEENLPLQPLLAGLTRILKVDDLFQDAHDSFFKPVVPREFHLDYVEPNKRNFRKVAGYSKAFEVDEAEDMEFFIESE